MVQPVSGVKIPITREVTVSQPISSSESATQVERDAYLDGLEGKMADVRQQLVQIADAYLKLHGGFEGLKNDPAYRAKREEFKGLADEYVNLRNSSTEPVS